MKKELITDEINEQAPVVATCSVEIKADVKTLWEILTDFEKWPQWNPDVNSMRMMGNVAKGSVFEWKAGSAKIKSTIQHVETPYFISWTGKMLGIKAIHAWQLTKIKNGTVVLTGESWDGFLVKLFKNRFQKLLENSLEKGLQYLNSEALKKIES